MADTDLDKKNLSDDEALVRAVARTICVQVQCEPGLCGGREDKITELDATEMFARSCVACRNVARSALRTIEFYDEFITYEQREADDRTD